MIVRVREPDPNPAPSRIRIPIHRGLVATTLLAIVCLVAGWPLLADPSAVPVDGLRPTRDAWRPPDADATGNDLTRIHWPRLTWQRRSIEMNGGRLAEWDPVGFAGRPAAANPQSARYDPTTRWLLRASIHPVRGLVLSTYVHLVVGAFGVYVLCRAYGCGWSASMVGGLCFSLAPYQLVQAYEGHFPQVWAACWMPWVVRSALGLSRDELWGCLLPPTLALCALTGHAQVAAYLGVFLLVWGLVDMITRFRRLGLRDGLRRLAAWGWAALLAAGITSVQWWPTWLAHSEWLDVQGAGRSPDYLRPWNLTQLLTPRALGDATGYIGPGNLWETMVGFGWIPFLLALVGVRLGWMTSRANRIWSIVALLGILHAVGDSVGGSWLVARVCPWTGWFRVPSRSLFLVVLGTSILAAFGWDGLRRALGGVESSRIMRRAAIASSILLSAATAFGILERSTAHPLPMAVGGSRAVPTAIQESNVNEISRLEGFIDNLGSDEIGRIAWFSSASGFGLLVWRGGRRRFRSIGSAILASGLIAELVLTSWALMPIAPRWWFEGPDPITDAIEREVEGTDEEDRDKDPIRIRAQDALYGDLRAAAAGIEKINVEDLVQVAGPSRLFLATYAMFRPERIVEADRDVASARCRMALDRLGARVIISDRPLEQTLLADVDSSRYPLLCSGHWDGRWFGVYRNPSAMPRAYMVPEARPLAGHVDPLDLLTRVDPRRTVLLEADAIGIDEPVATSQPSSMTRASYRPASPDRIEVIVEADGPGWLVVTDAWMPGWTATLNRAPVPILRADTAFRAVRIAGPGRHRVIMTYRTPGLEIASRIAWVAMGIVVLQLVLRLKSYY